MKPDRFTWIVIGAVVLLLIAAVVTVNRGSGTPSTPPAFRTDNTPESPIYNAFVAVERGEIYAARAYYSARVLEQTQRDGYDPFTSGYRGDNLSRQLRISAVDVDENNPDHAVVTVIVDNYATSGPFGSGNTWSDTRLIPVVREDGVWKIDAAEYFY